jgi:hypothetical protein
MVGEGILHKTLQHPAVESVLAVNRRSCGIEHQKLTEIIHSDFYDFSLISDKLAGYNACFFCLGVSSLGLDAETYKKITYDLTLHVATTLVNLNPEMTFCYVSGAGTDSSESGRSRWARVKGKTENGLSKLPFKGAYMFRPGYIQPVRGMKHTYKIYKVLAAFYPIWRILFPAYVCKLEEIAQAMIAVVMVGSDKKILENKDIVQLAEKGSTYTNEK